MPCNPFWAACFPPEKYAADKKITGEKSAGQEIVYTQQKNDRKCLISNENSRKNRVK
jgi:hypothetical protein